MLRQLNGRKGLAPEFPLLTHARTQRHAHTRRSALGFLPGSKRAVLNIEDIISWLIHNFAEWHLLVTRCKFEVSRATRAECVNQILMNASGENRCITKSKHTIAIGICGDLGAAASVWLHSSPSAFQAAIIACRHADRWRQEAAGSLEQTPPLGCK